MSLTLLLYPLIALYCLDYLRYLKPSVIRGTRGILKKARKDYWRDRKVRDCSTYNGTSWVFLGVFFAWLKGRASTTSKIIQPPNLPRISTSNLFF